MGREFSYLYRIVVSSLYHIGVSTKPFYSQHASRNYHHREFLLFNRARSLGVTYYSRFHFTILGCLLLTLVITATLMLQNYQFNIEIYQHNPLNVKYLSAWSLPISFYLPWVFIGNLGLKSYGEWAQKKFEQDMDELESME